MTLMQQAQHAYATASIPAKPDRALEYDVIAQATSKLKAAANEATSFPERVATIELNRRLWTVIATSVADAQNSLPPELKAQLFFLYEFTVDHSRKVIKGEADIAPLIDINLSVMRGLKTEPLL